MSRKQLASCILLLIFICHPALLFAQDPPRSAEQLLKRFEAAARAKDTKGILSLYNWGGVTDDMKSITNEETTDMLRQNIESIKLSPLPKDLQMEYVRNGFRFRPNVSVVGVIEIHSSLDNSTSTESIPYGKKGQVFYLANAVGEQIYAATTKERVLSVSVMGTFSPEKVVFNGYCRYLKGGKELRYEIKGRGNLSSSFWGDHIKYCHIQKTSTNGEIQLWISEGGKEVFKSSWEKTTRPVIYKGKLL